MPKVLKQFAHLEEQFKSLVLENEETCCRVFGKRSNVIDFLQTCPQHSDAVADWLLQGEHFEMLFLTSETHHYYYSLDALFQKLGSHNQELMERAFRGERKYEVVSLEECISLVQRFPDFEEDVLNPILTRKSLFVKVITTKNDIARLLKAFDVSEKVLDVLMDSSSEYLRQIAGFDVMKLILSFPSYHQRHKLVSFFIDKHFQLIFSYYELCKVSDVYPFYEDTFCLKILRDAELFSNFGFKRYATDRKRAFLGSQKCASGLILSGTQGGFCQAAKFELMTKNTIVKENVFNFLGNIAAVILECFSTLTKNPPKEVVILIMSDLIPVEIEHEKAMETIKKYINKS